MTSTCWYSSHMTVPDWSWRDCNIGVSSDRIPRARRVLYGGPVDPTMDASGGKILDVATMLKRLEENLRGSNMNHPMWPYVSKAGRRLERYLSSEDEAVHLKYRLLQGSLRALVDAYIMCCPARTVPAYRIRYELFHRLAKEESETEEHSSKAKGSSTDASELYKCMTSIFVEAKWLAKVGKINMRPLAQVRPKSSLLRALIERCTKLLGENGLFRTSWFESCRLFCSGSACSPEEDMVQIIQAEVIPRLQTADFFSKDAWILDTLLSACTLAYPQISDHLPSYRDTLIAFRAALEGLAHPAFELAESRA